MNGIQIESLSDFFEQITVLTEGYEFEYRGYTLRKAETKSLSPAHSTVEVLNTDRNHVETLNLGAFGSVESVNTFLDKILEYDPDSVDDWLNR